MSNNKNINNISDLLHRELIDINSRCYFLLCSNEDPFVFLRFVGTVKNRIIASDSKNVINNSITIYRIEVDDILESEEVLRAYLNNHSFRTFNKKSGRMKQKRIQLSKDKNIRKTIKTHLNDVLLESTSATTFLNINDMQREFIDINNYTTQRLMNWLSVLSSRK